MDADLTDGKSDVEPGSLFVIVDALQEGASEVIVQTLGLDVLYDFAQTPERFLVGIRNSTGCRARGYATETDLLIELSRLTELAAPKCSVVVHLDRAMDCDLANRLCLVPGHA